MVNFKPGEKNDKDDYFIQWRRQLRRKIRVLLIERRSVKVMLPWQQNFWITTIASLGNDDGGDSKNGKKQYVYISKTTLHVH